MGTHDDGADFIYRPIYALPYWDAVGSFIEQAVTDAASMSGRPARSLYPAVVPFVLWCWQTRGTPLERSRIFRATTVEDFVHRGMNDYLRGSRATHRSALRLTVEALNPAPSAVPGRPISRAVPTRPYTEPEVAALYSWATTQRTLRRRQDATALLALGLGAGLATREILGVRVGDVHVDSDGPHVTIWESRPRTVPFLEEWHQPLKRLLIERTSEGSPDAWLFRPGRHSTTTGQITDFLQRARTQLDVRPVRMRATWLLRHLQDGTPAQELLRISGLKNHAALDKIAAFDPRSGHKGNGFASKKRH